MGHPDCDPCCPRRARRVDLELDHRLRTFANGGRESATIEGPRLQLRALVGYSFSYFLRGEVGFRQGHRWSGLSNGYHCCPSVIRVLVCSLVVEGRS